MCEELFDQINAKIIVHLIETKPKYVISSSERVRLILHFNDIAAHKDSISEPT
jgi:hypothetical protein